MRLNVHVGSEQDRLYVKRQLEQHGLAFTMRIAPPPVGPHPLWVGMPEYSNEVGTWASFQVELGTKQEWEDATRALRQDLTRIRTEQIKRKSVWYPARAIRDLHSLVYNGPKVQPRYPVYIISKGRWSCRLTARALERMGVPYRIVVEKQEAPHYKAVIPAHQVLVLPESQCNLGRGSIPARNFVWDHARKSGARRHWILDDNIQFFCRRNRNAKHETLTGAMFRATEDFVDRFANAPIAGFQYDFFAPDMQGRLPALSLNIRVYSCLLIDHEQINHLRWRGTYNEDTDLCLRALKAGYCTILMNAFLQKKRGTQSMRGGNTDVLYKNGREAFVDSLVKQHPDVVSKTIKFNRVHHHVNYSPFAANALVPRRDAIVPPSTGVNNYQMRLVPRPAYARRRTLSHGACIRQQRPHQSRKRRGGPSEEEAGHQSLTGTSR